MAETESGIDTVEFIKLATGFMDHLTTLDTGSILMMATFIEKLFRNPRWKFLVMLSFVAFTSSIVGAVLVNFMLIMSESKTGPVGGPEEAIAIVGGLVALLGFLLGVLCLSLFGIRNLGALGGPNQAAAADAAAAPR
jgi:hypothetical protein